jgi:hypothetical protein
VSLIYDPCERIWLSINNSGGDRDRDSDNVVTDFVTVKKSVIISLHLYFGVVRWGKDRGL